MSSSISNIFFLFLIFTMFAYSTASFNNNIHKCPKKQSEALLLFKHNLSSINYPNDYMCGYPKMMSWNTSTDCCNWNGVSCDNSTGDVIGLDLNCGMLQGTIHPDSSLFNLTHLTSLDLSRNNLNQLAGQINVQTFRQLTNLTLLNLSHNNFSGELELDTLLTSLRNLEILLLSYSGFSVTTKNANHYVNPGFLVLYLVSCKLKVIPNSFRAMKQLKELDLSCNEIHGQIPHWVGEIGGNELFSLNLAYNFITGFSQFQCYRLAELYLQSNLIEEPFPPSICNMSTLSILDMSNNRIGGLIPQCFGNISFLQVLNVKSNKIQGSFPPSICNMSNLESLDMSNNRFGGVIPGCVGSLSTLSTIDFGTNNFHGTIPKNISSSLQFLNVKSNKIEGLFPPSICNMSYLSFLDMSNNLFGGVIPECVGSMSKLATIDLGTNNFHGTIPNVFNECRDLEGLILNGNQLEGEVPHSLSKCRSLKVLDLGNNNLNGAFPKWLGGLSDLQVLVLRSNNFNGPIETSTAMEHAFSSLQVLDLSHNWFAGKLPGIFFQNFKAMQNMVSNSTEPEYLSMGGEYYSIIAVVKDVQLTFTQLLVGYTIVDLSNNRFEGEIPKAIGSLNSLKALNLSHNNLNGEIPNALGKLLGTESLDLSWNQLIGEIPQSLTEIKGLEVLNLSQNLLEGRIPQGKQFNTFDESSYGGNLRLCGFPLSNKCEHLSSPNVYGDGDEEEVDESGFTWKVVTLGYGCGTLFGLVMGYLMLSTRKVKWFNAIVDAADRLVLKKMKKKRRHIYIGK